MRREELSELHFITPIVNVGSILDHGILSHRLMEQLRHESVAMTEIQVRRARVVVPSGRRGRPLHEYANLYICSRNPMLCKLQGKHRTLCVLQVSTNVLDLPGVVIADRNAAAGICRFSAVPNGLALVDRERVFAEFWTHDDEYEQRDHKAEKCAEVLVPDRIDPEYIVGAYVSCLASRESLAAAAPGLPITVDGHLFFR